jgi:hypothetical protein
VSYSSSRNRQWHIYSVSERKNRTSLALKRVFLRWAGWLPFPLMLCLLFFMCLLSERCSVQSASFADLLTSVLPLPLPLLPPPPACRGVVRQLGKPNLLAATYSSNAAAAATAAMEELEETLLGSLQELQRIGSGVGEQGVASILLVERRRDLGC